MAALSLTQKPRVATFWTYLLLAACTLLVYWPVSHHDFVAYDDSDFVAANPIVQKGLTLEGFKWVWHSEVARNWHPVTMLTHMLDCQFFGLNAGPPHLVNLFIHVANSLLLFHLLKFLTGAPWRSAFVAGLFALHPLHVESVAWLAERKDVLSTFFWFLTFLAYARYARGTNKKSSYALALIFFALGLMSKPMLVTGPFVLLLLDFWPLGRINFGSKPAPQSRSKKTPSAPRSRGGEEKHKNSRGGIANSTQTPFAKLLIEKLPFLVMSLVLCIITYEIQQHGGAVQATTSLPLGYRIGNAFVSYARYIQKMCWPQNLAGLYLRTDAWPVWMVALAVIFVAATTVFALAQRRNRPWFTMGWFWYLGILVPVIGLVQVGMQTMADRFTYVSSIGIFIIVTWGFCELAGRWRLPKITAAVLGGAILLTCMALTARQQAYWENSETLFNRMVAVTRNNYMAHYNHANVYSRQKRYDAAITNYEAAIQEEPNYADAHNNYGGLLLEMKRYDEAIHQYEEAARVHTQYLFYFNLANALADAASARGDTNEFARAVQTYGQALQLNPSSSDAHNNLGMTWQAQGREAEAAAEFRQATQLKPDFELAQFNLANALSRLGRLDEAISEYRAAEKLKPDRVETYNGLGICFAMQNKMAEAAGQFKAVLQLQPDNAAAYGNLANALAAQGKFDEAIPTYAEAIRLNPKDYQSEFNLGLTYSRQGKKAEAATNFRRALEIKPDYAEARQALDALQTSK